MRTALIIGGIAAVVPYAWDSVAINQFSASSGNVELFTFSGQQAIYSWEQYLAIAGIVALVIALLLVI